MSKLNGGLYSSADHTWETPPDLDRRLREWEGITHWDLDPACSTRNIPAYMHYLYPEWDGLVESWEVGLDKHDTRVYLNPPYGAEIQKFLRKVCEEAAKGVKIWVLAPARTETAYQNQYGLSVAGFTVFISERLKFYMDGKPYMIPEKKNGIPTGRMIEGNAPFPAMLMYYGPDWPDKARRWKDDPPIKGTLMMPIA